MVMVMTRHNTKQTNASLKKNTLPEGVICIATVNKYKYDDERKIVMSTSHCCLLSVKGQDVKQQTYFNFFTTLTEV